MLRSRCFFVWEKELENAFFSNREFAEQRRVFFVIWRRGETPLSFKFYFFVFFISIWLLKAVSLRVFFTPSPILEMNEIEKQNNSSKIIFLQAHTLWTFITLSTLSELSANLFTLSAHSKPQIVCRCHETGSKLIQFFYLVMANEILVSLLDCSAHNNPSENDGRGYVFTRHCSLRPFFSLTSDTCLLSRNQGAMLLYYI